MRLRPHHALCLRFFIGRGYSEDFVRHMYEITDRLADDPEITLVEGCDTVCEACPHRIGGVCDTAEKVAAIDRRALDAAKVNIGDVMRWTALSALVEERIIGAEKLFEVCRGCQWIGICEKGLPNG